MYSKQSCHEKKTKGYEQLDNTDISVNNIAVNTVQHAYLNDTTPVWLPSYKLTLWAFGSCELKTGSHDKAN